MKLRVRELCTLNAWPQALRAAGCRNWSPLPQKIYKTQSVNDAFWYVSLRVLAKFSAVRDLQTPATSVLIITYPMKTTVGCLFTEYKFDWVYCRNNTLV
jgi:hypothetical protein